MLFVLGSIDIQRHGALLAQQLDERAAIVRLASAMAIGCFGEPPLPRAVTEVLLSHLEMPANNRVLVFQCSSERPTP